jgi:drug/metabolite transporter (DMT)-like permease
MQTGFEPKYDIISCDQETGKLGLYIPTGKDNWLNQKTVRADWLLLLTAAIWGMAFVAQRAGMSHVGPFTFNGIRFFLGALVLMPIIFHHNRRYPQPPGKEAVLFTNLPLSSGLVTGGVLFFGASLQQIGMVYTTAAKGGFITGLYVILVPIIGLFFGHRPGWGSWLGSVLATIGLYLLSVNEDLTFDPGDLWVLAGAFFWAGHVLLIGHLSPRVDAVQLACAQFLVCSFLSSIVALVMESITLAGIRGGAIPILYGGLMSVGIAYTLQVVAQRDAPPAHASIILSLETVFAAVAGWVILNESLPFRAIGGCVLMLAGMLAVQLLPGRSD